MEIKMTEDPDQRDREISGYERMLGRLRDSVEDWRDETGPRLRWAIDRLREQAVELNELTHDEADRVARWLRRDVEEAADYSVRTERDLSNWLSMDIQLVESWLWERFSSVADQTRLDWLRFQQSLADNAEYHTGEIAAPGSLACDACNATLRLRQAGHIPPCPSCGQTVFYRAAAGRTATNADG